jgi:general secretion pathway protein F
VPNFAYRALTAAGERVTGELEAADVPAAIARLQDSGLIPIDATPAGRTDRRASAPVVATRAVRHVTQLTRELATLIGAGQTVEGALALAREEVPDRGLATALEAVLLKVRSGASLSDALAAEPRFFPPLYVSLVRAGEASGRFSEGLTLHLSAFHDRLYPRGKAKKLAITACMRKLLVILNAVLARGTPWRTAQPA